ncbi:unnamed protein product [Brassica oleracea]
MQRESRNALCALYFFATTEKMCGILAVLGCTDDSQAKRVRVLELSRRQFFFSLLRHRGPDWSGIYQHEDNYLAHERLAIVDPDSGDQPLFNEDKTIVVTVRFMIFIHLELITFLIFLDADNVILF